MRLWYKLLKDQFSIKYRGRKNESKDSFREKIRDAGHNLRNSENKKIYDQGCKRISGYRERIKKYKREKSFDKKTDTQHHLGEPDRGKGVRIARII